MEGRLEQQAGYSVFLRIISKKEVLTRDEKNTRDGKHTKGAAWRQGRTRQIWNVRDRKAGFMGFSKSVLLTRRLCVLYTLLLMIFLLPVKCGRKKQLGCKGSTEGMGSKTEQGTDLPVKGEHEDGDGTFQASKWDQNWKSLISKIFTERDLSEVFKEEPVEIERALDDYCLRWPFSDYLAEIHQPEAEEISQPNYPKVIGEHDSKEAIDKTHTHLHSDSMKFDEAKEHIINNSASDDTVSNPPRILVEMDSLDDSKYIEQESDLEKEHEITKQAVVQRLELIKAKLHEGIREYIKEEKGISLDDALKPLSRESFDVREVLLRDNRNPPLFYAIESGKTDLVKCLLEIDAPMYFYYYPELKNAEPYYHYYPAKCKKEMTFENYPALNLALMSERFNVVSLLLKNGADASHQDKLGNTGMHYAAKHCHAKMMNQIIFSSKQNEAINKVNDRGHTALHVALLSRNEDAALALLGGNAKTDILFPSRNTVLHAALMPGEKSMDKVALKLATCLESKLLNAKSHPGGCSALYMALLQGKTEVASHLLHRGAKIIQSSCNVDSIISVFSDGSQYFDASRKSTTDSGTSSEPPMDKAKKFVENNAPDTICLSEIHYAIYSTMHGWTNRALDCIKKIPIDDIDGNDRTEANIEAGCQTDADIIVSANRFTVLEAAVYFDNGKVVSAWLTHMHVRSVFADRRVNMLFTASLELNKKEAAKAFVAHHTSGAVQQADLSIFCNDTDYTICHILVEENCLSLLNSVVDKSHLNLASKTNHSPLWFAVARSRLDAANALLACGALLKLDDEPGENVVLNALTLDVTGIYPSFFKQFACDPVRSGTDQQPMDGTSIFSDDARIKLAKWKVEAADKFLNQLVPFYGQTIVPSPQTNGSGLTEFNSDTTVNQQQLASLLKTFFEHIDASQLPPKNVNRIISLTDPKYRQVLLLASVKFIVDNEAKLNKMLRNALEEACNSQILFLIEKIREVSSATGFSSIEIENKSDDGADNGAVFSKEADSKIRMHNSHDPSPKPTKSSLDEPILITSLKRHCHAATRILLTDKLMKINSTDADGNNPLHFCKSSVENHLRFLEIFLARGIDPNAQNSAGNTPLHAAVERNDWPVVQCLLQNDKTNPNIKNKNEMTVSEILLSICINAEKIYHECHNKGSNQRTCCNQRKEQASNTDQMNTDQTNTDQMNTDQMNTDNRIKNFKNALGLMSNPNEQENIRCGKTYLKGTIDYRTGLVYTCTYLGFTKMITQNSTQPDSNSALVSSNPSSSSSAQSCPSSLGPRNGTKQTPRDKFDGIVVDIIKSFDRDLHAAYANAADKNQRECFMNFLLDHSDFSSLLIESDANKNTFLHHAVKDGLANEIIRRLLSVKGMKITAKNAKNFTALDYALFRDLETIHILLDSTGLDTQGSGEPPFDHPHVHAGSCKVDAPELYKEPENRVLIKNAIHAALIREAVHHVDFDLEKHIQYFLNLGVDPNETISRTLIEEYLKANDREHLPICNMSPINLAIYLNCNTIAQLLIDNGVDINKPDIENNTPLSTAAIYNNSRILPWLINRDADIYFQTSPRRKLGDIAIEHNNFEFFTALLSKLLNLDRHIHQALDLNLIRSSILALIASNENFFKPLPYVALFGHMEPSINRDAIITPETLENSTRDPTKAKFTSFKSAFVHNSESNQLLQNSKDFLDIYDSNDKHPIHYFLTKGRLDIVEYIIEEMYNHNNTEDFKRILQYNVPGDEIPNDKKNEIVQIIFKVRKKKLSEMKQKK